MWSSISLTSVIGSLKKIFRGPFAVNRKVWCTTAHNQQTKLSTELNKPVVTKILSNINSGVGLQSTLQYYKGRSPSNANIEI